MNHSCKNYRRRGFTLVKLLVLLLVVVVLGVLGVGLFGRFSEIRQRNHEMGQRLTCQDQMKRLAMAALLYSADNDGAFPGEEFQYEMYPYMKTKGRFQCPTFTETTPYAAWRVGPTHYIFNYVYNGYELDSSRASSGGKGKVLARVASGTWAFAEDFTRGEAVTGYVDYSACKGTHAWSTMHQGGSNYAFADGHVKWMGAEEVACSGK